MPSALIVEDEPAANQLLSMLVQLRGYQTTSAFTGGDAIRQADDYRPDLVFLDLMLPDINGYEVCKTLRERRATTDIPIVMVTARLAAENRIQGFRVGAIEYVPKPYTPDQIFQAISRADSWRKWIEDPRNSGEFLIDTRDEVAYLQQTSDLRSLLLGQTSLDEETVRQANASLLTILQRGVDWGKTHQREQVATVGFHLESSSLRLKIHDISGWLDEDDPRQNGMATLISESVFQRTDHTSNTELELVLASDNE